VEQGTEEINDQRESKFSTLWFRLAGVNWRDRLMMATKGPQLILGMLCRALAVSISIETVNWMPIKCEYCNLVQVPNHPLI
jgi:hypothetical protein